VLETQIWGYVADFQPVPVAETQVEKPVAEPQRGPVIALQVEQLAAQPQPAPETTLDVEGSVAEPPIERLVSGLQAEPEKESQEESLRAETQEESVAASTEIEPTELARVGAALERVRDLVAGRMDMPEFAVPKQKRTAKFSSDIAAGPFKKPRIESTSAQLRVSPTPAEKLAMAEGKCQPLLAAFQLFL